MAPTFLTHSKVRFLQDFFILFFIFRYIHKYIYITQINTYTNILHQLKSYEIVLYKDVAINFK